MAAAPNGLQKRGLDLYKNPMTNEDVETIVARSLGPGYKIHNYYVKSYSNENLGFMGAHRNFVVEVSPDGSSPKERHTYFLKSVPYNIGDQAKFVEDSKMFFKETSFYKLIMPELMASSLDKSWAPQCYLVKDDALVFENLAIRDYALRDKWLDVASLESALTSLAKMHAASLLAEKRLGKSFIQLYPHLMDELIFNLDGPFSEWNLRGIEVLVQVAKNLGLNDELVSRTCRLVYEKIKPSRTRRNVVCHGDAWSNNLMFSGAKCALVDFQLMRYVPPATDVAQLIYHNARKELRDEHETRLLRHYHGIFSDALREGGLTAPTFEDLRDEYEEQRIVGVVMINMYYQINHIPGEKQLELMGSSEGFNSLIYGERVGLVTGLMDAYEAYRQDVSSALRELIDIAPKYLN